MRETLASVVKNFISSPKGRETLDYLWHEAPVTIIHRELRRLGEKISFPLLPQVTLGATYMANLSYDTKSTEVQEKTWAYHTKAKRWFLMMGKNVRDLKLVGLDEREIVVGCFDVRFDGSNVKLLILA